MIDKGKMREEFEAEKESFIASHPDWKYADTEALWLYFWQAAKESDRKEREAAKQRIAELEESLQECTNSLREKHHAKKSLQVEKEVLEKKLEIAERKLAAIAAEKEAEFLRSR